MRKSITQEQGYGCGVACYAFALKITYPEAVAMLGEQQSNSTRFYVKDLVAVLNGTGAKYMSRHIKSGCKDVTYLEGDIVLIRRSKRYPVGHYLIRYKGQWMDPWINMVVTNYDMSRAISGYRKKLPGRAMYVIRRS